MENREFGNEIKIVCDHLVGADGVRSKVRESISADMIGHKSKTLMRSFKSSIDL